MSSFIEFLILSIKRESEMFLPLTYGPMKASSQSEDIFPAIEVELVKEKSGHE